MRNVRGFIVVTQTAGTPGSPDVFIVGLAIPLPKLFCFAAPGYADEAALSFARLRIIHGQIEQSEKARGEYVLINEAFRRQRQKGI